MSMQPTLPLARTGLPIRRLSLQRLDDPRAPVFVGALDRVTLGSAEGNDLRLEDPTVSRFHAVLHRRGDRIVVRDLGSTNGTVIGPVRLQDGEGEIASETTIRLGNVALIVRDGDVVMVEHGPGELGGLVGRSPAMRQLLAQVQKTSRSDVPVLVLGESGTGKELVGRALHEGSPRASAPFVTVDCGALSSTLFSSELFGHEKGAFTGAHRQHPGAFERASGGTLFLDEVGELSPEQQSALLGALERKTIRRLGGTRDLPVNVRLISATSRDLLKEVNQGRFRLDLFYRLAVVRLDMPPLREHPEDIPLLIQHFLQDEGAMARMESLFDRDALTRLKNHAWPGNARELRNYVLGALALGQVPEFVGAGPGALAGPPADKVSFVEDGHVVPYKDARRQIVDTFERRYLRDLLEATRGNIRESARQAQMNRSYLIELLSKHGLPE